jgi:hypothetical protein
MAYLGLAPKNTISPGQHVLLKEPGVMQDSTSDEEKRLAAAAALSAVKDAAEAKMPAAAAVVSGVKDAAEAKRRAAAAALSAVKDAAAAAASRGKVEVTTSFANTLLIVPLWCSCSIVSYWLHSLAMVYVVNIEVDFCLVV